MQEHLTLRNSGVSQISAWKIWHFVREYVFYNKSVGSPAKMRSVFSQLGIGMTKAFYKRKFPKILRDLEKNAHQSLQKRKRFRLPPYSFDPTKDAAP